MVLRRKLYKRGRSLVYPRCSQKTTPITKYLSKQSSRRILITKTSVRWSRIFPWLFLLSTSHQYRVLQHLICMIISFNNHSSISLVVLLSDHHQLPTYLLHWERPVRPSLVSRTLLFIRGNTRFQFCILQLHCRLSSRRKLGSQLTYYLPYPIDLCFSHGSSPNHLEIDFTRVSVFLLSLDSAFRDKRQEKLSPA
jgi:hypothetical protein